MAPRKRILLLAETGFIIRNLLLGYFSDEITKTADLIVAVQRPDDPALIEFARSNKGVSFIPFPFESYEDGRTMWQRFKSWDNWIYGIRSAWKNNLSIRIQTRLFEGIGGAKKRFIRMLPMVVGYVIKALSLDAWLEDRYLNGYICKKSITREWIEGLKKLAPDMLFSTMLTHSTRFRCSTDLPVVMAAHSLGLPVCTLIQSWDNLSSKVSVLPRWVDQYYTWSQSMTDELLQLNPLIQPDKAIIVGSPQYDFHLNSGMVAPREEFLLALGADASKSMILIGTGTAQWMPDEMEKVVSLSARIIRDITNSSVIIRLHPKDDGLRWEPYAKQLKSMGVALQYTSTEVHMDHGGFMPALDFYKAQINTIHHSAVIINSSSSLTVDAAILDKPVLCLAYDLRADPIFPEGRALAFSRSVHFRKLVDTGGVPLILSETSGVDAIKRYIDDPGLDSDGRRRIVETVTDQIQVKSGIRLAHAVMQFIKSRV